MEYSLDFPSLIDAQTEDERENAFGKNTKVALFFFSVSIVI